MKKPAVILEGKMTISQYTGIHHWARQHFGTPNICEECGTSENRRYEWANISGEYKRERSDWRRLCKPCHARLDRTWLRRDMKVCKRGHELTPENIYERKGTPTIECRACINIAHKKYKARIAAMRKEAA